MTGLSNNTLYAVRIRARYGELASAASPIRRGTPEAAPAPPAPPEPPPKPGGVRAEPGNGQVVLRWSTVPGGAATTSHTVTSLTNGTAYIFQVRAVARHNNTDVNGAASQATATPEAPPGQPMGLSVRPGDGQVQLSWRALPTAMEGWQYQYCPTGDCPGTWTDIANRGLMYVSAQALKPLIRTCFWS